MGWEAWLARPRPRSGKERLPPASHPPQQCPLVKRPAPQPCVSPATAADKEGRRLYRYRKVVLYEWPPVAPRTLREPMSKGDLPAASTSASYTPYPERPPLCFLAVPKTASGLLSQWLESMFPVAERAPYRLETDFEQCGDDGGQYRLYNGHIIGGQLHMLAASTAVLYDHPRAGRELCLLLLLCSL